MHKNRNCIREVESIAEKWVKHKSRQQNNWFKIVILFVLAVIAADEIPGVIMN